MTNLKFLESGSSHQAFRAGTEQFSLTSLSPQARRLVSLAIITPGKLKLFIEQPELAWVWAEEAVGPLSLAERQVLEGLADLFLGSSVLVIPGQVFNDLCWGSQPI
jgi:hypothetical protein